MTRASHPQPAGSAAIRRAYTGPAILHGFRLFFMAAAIWAVIAMVAWIPCSAACWCCRPGWG
ncbi:hypothetical protein ACFQ4K_33110 [Tistrella bauzanensis]